MSVTLSVILTHQPEPLVKVMTRWWADHCPGTDVLIAYGGPPEGFAALTAERKVFVTDARLRTSDHQRERQSYTGVFRAVRTWLGPEPSYQRVLFTEFDCLPLCSDLPERLEGRLQEEGADVLACQVERIDGTNHPHYLYHAADPQFRPFLQRLSVREGKGVVLSMLGCMSYWTRGVFMAVASVEETTPLYLELALPTLAHHLGARVRGLKDHAAFVRPNGNLIDRLDALRAEGAWMAHPVKGFWERLAALETAAAQKAAGASALTQHTP